VRTVAAALGTAAGAGLLGLALAARGVPTAMGAPEDVLRAVAAASPRATDGRFRNTEPSTLLSGSNAELLRALLTRGRTGWPAHPVPLALPPPPGPAAPLAVTWYGHSSVLVEIDGRRLLADPMWSERASPSLRIGPRRMHPVPAPLAALPPVDAVLISHDHYDHLDAPTVRSLLRLGRHDRAPFVVPLGVGEHLRYWGVPRRRVIELDWGGTAEVAGVGLTCTEARHFSGRGLTRNTTLWSSWAVTGPAHRAYFGGDTGYTAAFAEAGRALGPFDLVLLPIGAYNHRWPDVHMTPEETVGAVGDLRGGVLLPVHWATFNLGFHSWADPVQRVRAAAGSAGVRLVVPIPGQRVDLPAPTELRDWWTAIA
jgi:L-ascorbate metabolism protein UlaG (beta-lactamase superfamily)